MALKTPEEKRKWDRLTDEMEASRIKKYLEDLFDRQQSIIDDSGQIVVSFFSSYINNFTAFGIAIEWLRKESLKKGWELTTDFQVGFYQPKLTFTSIKKEEVR